MSKILNFRLISKVISFNLFIVGGSFLACIVVALIYAEDITPFVKSALITLGVAFVLWLGHHGNKQVEELNRRDAYLTVTISWLLLGFAGTLPYLFSKSIPDFTNALFESVSGFTTTGSSILMDIESLPKSILFWRSLTHWIGGIGIILLVVIILPSLKIGGYHLFTSESSLQDKIKPKIQQVGRRIFLIYINLTIAEIILLMLGKMPLFDSICHAFGTIATGGFSPKNTSIALYSPYIQYVIMIFMFLSGTNFIIHYYLLKRDISRVKENNEFFFYTITTFVIGGLVTAALYFQAHLPFETAFRDAFFQVISIITSTGFASADYLLWPQVAWVLILFSMFLGGSTGSTSGGIKMARYVIFTKTLRNYFWQITHPNAVVPIKINNKVVPHETIYMTLSFMVMYFMVFVVGTITLIILGLDAKTSGSAVATCMAGIGPGIGTVGPVSNFAHLPELGKAILVFIMILGRLEIFTVLVLFRKSFWKA